MFNIRKKISLRCTAAWKAFLLQACGYINSPVLLQLVLCWVSPEEGRVGKGAQLHCVGKQRRENKPKFLLCTLAPTVCGSQRGNSGGPQSKKRTERKSPIKKHLSRETSKRETATVFCGLALPENCQPLCSKQSTGFISRP